MNRDSQPSRCSQPAANRVPPGDQTGRDEAAGGVGGCSKWQARPPGHASPRRLRLSDAADALLAALISPTTKLGTGGSLEEGGVLVSYSSLPQPPYSPASPLRLFHTHAVLSPRQL
ncbi:hypothetical protein E2C01_059649 [Portunus trituberculatus]|uniref:Uncharacterized protein n=1 Tax=Portunus trituberculatus TaxID=210409 RepID=A0A5B7H5Y2_PORTR|nr:hypothetical protein [Portunus trituberculatus]